MAGKMEVDYETVVEEFRDKGFGDEQIKDEIEAWKFGTGSKNIYSLRTHLNKSLKVKEKKVLLQDEIISSLPPPSLITQYPQNCELNDDLEKHMNLHIESSSIENDYFLEDQAKVEANLLNHLKLVTSNFEDSYSVSLKKIFESEEEEEDFWVVGRVELNEDDEQDQYNLVTETEKCPINYLTLPNYTIYPGQIILTQGSLQSMTFIPKKILIDSFGDLSPESELNKKLKIGLLSGPFTGPDLDFTYFLSVLKVIANQVNILILVGPFVDCENEIIKSCNLNIPSLKIRNGSYEMIIHEIFSCLESIKNVKIVLVPHEREVVHLYPLPMPELSRSIPNNFICTTSPGFLNIENLIVHIVPYDILYEMNSVMSIRSNTLANKTQIALNQLIQQQSYLPLIPNNLPVEYSNFNHFVFEQIPNILIVNTKLSIQPNAVSGVTCVKMIPFVDGQRIGNYTIINSGKHNGKLLVNVKNYRANF